MTEQLYQGSCHCGAVAFDVTLDITQTVTCNCSRCQRLGSVLSFTEPGKFTLLRGSESLTEYLFNKKVIRHQFCKVCGIECFAFARTPDGKEGVAVNVNTLEGVNPRALRSQHFDGRSM